MARMDWDKARRVHGDSEGGRTSNLKLQSRVRYCNECKAKLVGGQSGNIKWFQRDGKWKPGPLCKDCSARPVIANTPEGRSLIRDASPVGKVHSKLGPRRSGLKGQMK